MRYAKLTTLAATALLATSLAACGDDSSSGSDAPDPEVAETSFEAGTTMADLADAGKITIGVKIDQPGLGFQAPGADEPEGFDVEIAKIVAAGLGLSGDQIEWKETISDNREPFLEDGEVDLVFATYSITDERREIVGQAGPYYVTGQQMLVRAEDEDTYSKPEQMADAKVCSVEGSTPLALAQDEYGADPIPLGTYSECVAQLENGTVDIVTTDGSILLGYAAENPDELKVVGPEFSEENYGVGYTLGDTEMCEFINSTLQEAMDNGDWATAFESTLGQAGVETPEPPALDPCL